MVVTFNDQWSKLKEKQENLMNENQRKLREIQERNRMKNENEKQMFEVKLLESDFRVC